MVKVIGHRGARGYEPENTLRSIRRAIQLGCHIVEVDVRMTRDGHLVLMHDETVDRTTDGTGRLRDMTLAEVRRLDAGLGERVPLLSEALELARSHGVEVIVEVKEPDTVNKVVDVVRECGVVDKVIVASFHHPVVKEAVEAEPGLRGGVIFMCEPVDPAYVARSAGASVLIANYRYVTSRMVRLAHEAGLEVYVWTVNTAREARLLAGLGVDGIASDKPDVVFKALRQRTLL